MIPFTRRRCPYCGAAFSLGTCPIVATNYTVLDSGDGDRSGGLRPASGDTPHGVIGGRPVVRRAQLEVRRRYWLLDVGRTLVTAWWLRPVRKVADPRDLPARVCRGCEHPLPVDIDTRRIITIAVLGTKHSGKSHYLASALHEASRLQGLRDAGCEEFEPDEHTAKAYHERYYEPLFLQRNQLPSTDFDEEISFSPLVYRVQFADTKPCALLLHDVSGEMLDSPEVRARYVHFIYRADGAIFLLDPDQLELPVKHPSADPGVRTYNQADLLNAWLGGVDRAIPIALTLSKSDVVTSAYPEETHHLQEEAATTDSRIWSRQMARIGQQVQDVLEKVGARDVLAATRRRDGVSFHAVAALGCSVDEHGSVTELRPMRCLDPLVTVLTRIPGVVDGKE